MPDHGTTSNFPDWYIRFQQAALAALPRPPQLDQATALDWAENKSGAMKQGFLFLVSPEWKTSSIPADGEEFELTLDQPVDPMEMVRGDGYDPKNWKFTGQQVGPQTRRFKLVRVGYCKNLDEVREKLALHGDPAEGQWREAFKRVYPQNDGNGPVGFPGASWLDPRGFAGFPALFESGKRWNSHFGWPGYGFSGRWRWLVACE